MAKASIAIKLLFPAHWRCILTYGFFNISFNVTSVTYNKYIPENLIDASINGPLTSISIQTGAIPGGSPEITNTIIITSGEGVSRTFIELTLPWHIIDRLAEFCANHKTGQGNPGLFEEEFNLNVQLSVNNDPVPLNVQLTVNNDPVSLVGGKRTRRKRRKYNKLK